MNANPEPKDGFKDRVIRVFISSTFRDMMRERDLLAVVLLTKEALESEYILKTEFLFLRERQQRDKLPVFPVVCEECNWKAHDWLRATQSPNESNPLAQLSEPAQDRVFRKLATDIAEELSRVSLAECSSRREEALTEASALRVPHSEPKTYLDKFSLARNTGQREEKLIGRERTLLTHDDLLKTFPVWLAKARIKAERDGVRCIVVLDALNQLEDRDHARLLGWLPSHPFTGALRLVASTLPGETLTAVESRGWKSLRVQPLTTDERRRMVQRSAASHLLAKPKEQG